jgi:predicted YcjX-like family ATPase
VIFSNIAEGLTRSVEGAADTLSETFFEPVIRLGVTGLSRAGKTVFITSLVANLLERGRMPGLAAAAEGRIPAAFLQPQPDDTVPRFDYETHLATMTGADPLWPQSTRAVSELRLSLRVRPAGLLAGVTGLRTVHIDIVDYPGEWLLDLALLEKDYATWSAEVLTRIESRAEAAEYLKTARATDPATPLDEPQAQGLAKSFTGYLNAARAAGFTDCTPGRFLLPGDLEGSPALTFAPLPAPGKSPRNSLWRDFERRFEAYKAQVVRPFFRAHFARIDRQVVLVDVLGALHRGPQAMEDMRRAMAEILGAFRPGRAALLARLIGARRVDKILFAATKSDHLHHSQHARLSLLTQALVQEARTRAEFAGAETRAMALASLRATTEETRTHNGETVDLVRGTLLNPDGTRGRQAAYHPGTLPEDPARLLTPAKDGAEAWLDAEFGAMRFAPAAHTLKPGEGPPHIRLDRAAQFLIGDRL